MADDEYGDAEMEQATADEDIRQFIEGIETDEKCKELGAFPPETAFVQRIWRKPGSLGLKMTQTPQGVMVRDDRHALLDGKYVIEVAEEPIASDCELSAVIAKTKERRPLAVVFSTMPSPHHPPFAGRATEIVHYMTESPMGDAMFGIANNQDSKYGAQVTALPCTGQ